MDLGQKIRAARLEAGLSQRQLCGDTITRNMLSQIENGSAKPSMQTLSYLAGQLGKSVSFFLDEDTVTSPNQQVMARAREAWQADMPAEVQRVLTDYRAPDPVFDSERQLLECLALLAQASHALEKGQYLFAEQLLQSMPITDGYCAGELERKRLLLLARAKPQLRQEICRKLPDLDEELRLRAADALDRGQLERSEHLLEAAEDQENENWNFLRGEVYLARQQYRLAAGCYHRAEKAFPEKTASRLEVCYRELGDYQQAYYYSCRQR